MNPKEVLEVRAMIERWASRLRRRAAKKGVDIEDLKSAGILAALRAHRTYDPAKGALTTHMYTPVNYAMLRELLALGSPVTQPRDAYELEPLHRGEELKDYHVRDEEQSTALEAAQMVRRIMETAGPMAELVVATLLRVKTLKVAADEAGVAEEDMRQFIAWVQTEVRRE